MNDGQGLYDVLVWIDDDGDVVCNSLSAEGLAFLRSLDPSYEEHQILQIMCRPDEFANLVPNNVLVGMRRSPSGKIVPMEHPRLH